MDKVIKFCWSPFLLARSNVTAPTASALSRNTGQHMNQACLPTGLCLNPAGRSFAASNVPFAMVLLPEGDRLVSSLNGWHQSEATSDRPPCENNRAEFSCLRASPCEAFRISHPTFIGNQIQGEAGCRVEPLST